MQIFNKVMQFISVISLLTVAFLALFIPANIRKASEFLYILNYNKVVPIFIGFIIVFFFFFWILIQLWEKKKHQMLIISGEKGEISICLTAIEDFVKKLCLKIEGVKDIKVKALKQRKCLKLNTKFTLTKSSIIPQITSEAKEFVEKQLRDVLGIKGVLKINFQVRKIETSS